MRVIGLALKDLLQVARDRKSIVFLVLVPIAFTLFFGFVLSGAISDPRLPVGWINAGGEELLASKLEHMLEQSAVVRLVPFDMDQASSAAQQVQDEKLAAAMSVPPGFTTQALSGKALPVTVIVLPGSSAGRTASSAIQVAVNHLVSAVVISQISVETFEAQQPFISPELRQDYANQALQLADQAWVQPSFTIREASAAEEAGPAQIAQKGFLQSSPGMIFQSAIMGLTTCSMVLFLERKNKMLERLLTSPIRRAEIIGGHILGVFIVVFLQELLLAAFSQVLFGVDYLRQPFGTLLMMAALALWVACLGLLIGVVSRTAEVVILFSIVSMLFFSALGGAWFPLEITGQTFSAIGHVSPAAWAMDGFQNIILRGQGLTSTFLPAGVLLAFAAAFFGLAVWRFKAAASN